MKRLLRVAIASGLVMVALVFLVAAGVIPKVWILIGVGVYLGTGVLVFGWAFVAMRRAQRRSPS